MNMQREIIGDPDQLAGQNQLAREQQPWMWGGQAQGKYTDEGMLKYVNNNQKGNISYDVSYRRLKRALEAEGLDSEEHMGRFAYFWEYNQRPPTYGAALKQGFGGEVPGANFVNSVDEMITGMADLFLVEGPKMVGSGVRDLALAGTPNEAGFQARARLEFPKRFMNQLTKELMQDDTPEMKVLRGQLDHERRLLKPNHAKIARLSYELDKRVQEYSPIMAFLQEEILYFQDPELVKQKIATAPAEVLSDIVGLLTLPLAGGAAVAGKGSRIASKLRKMMTYLDYADPAALPQSVAKGIGRALGPESRIMKGPDADMTNQRAVQFGEDELGVDRMEQPDYYQNQEQIFQTREMMRADTEGKVGQQASQRTVGMEKAFKDYETRLVEGVNTGDSPIEAENAGKLAMDLYKERQVSDRSEVNQLFSQWNANYDTAISPEFGLESKLQAIIDDLEGSGEAVSQWRRDAAIVLRQELDAMRQQQAKSLQAQSGDPNKVVSNDELSGINEMSLQSLDQIRTTFRERYNNEFIGQATQKTGGYAMEKRVYDQLTDLLYDASDDTVQRSGGAMPADLSDNLLAAKTRRAEIAQLENSYGGEFVVKHRENPQGLIKGLIEDKKLTTDELKNAYEVMGEESATVLRASVMNTIFEQMRDSPKGLETYLNKITQGRDPAWLAELFGGGKEGQEIADKINDLAEFSALMEPKSRIFSNSPTGKVNMALARGQAGEIIDTAIDVGIEMATQAKKRDFKDITVTGIAWMVGSWLKNGSKSAWNYMTKNSEWARKRMLHGHELGPEAVKIFDMMASGGSRAGLKGTEITSRLADGEDKDE